MYFVNNVRQLLADAIVAIAFPDFHETCQMKLDPEEQIIAAALDQAELDDANERGVGARIEFRRKGDARVTMTISRALVEKATTLNLVDWRALRGGNPDSPPRRVQYRGAR